MEVRDDLHSLCWRADVIKGRLHDSGVVTGDFKQ